MGLMSALVPVALLQPLEQLRLRAQPVQSLPDVAHQLHHAALLAQSPPHRRVQVLEEVCRTQQGESRLLLRIAKTNTLYKP